MHPNRVGDRVPVHRVPVLDADACLDPPGSFLNDADQSFRSLACGFSILCPLKGCLNLGSSFMFKDEHSESMCPAMFDTDSRY